MIPLIHSIAASLRSSLSPGPRALTATPAKASHNKIHGALDYAAYIPKDSDHPPLECSAGPSKVHLLTV